MKKIAIVYHSGYGHTQKQAEAVLKGVQSIENVDVDLIKTEDVVEDLDRLDQYDAMIFGTPTYMGGVSADFKRFMDASSAKWFTRTWQNKIAAGFTNSNSLSGDKLNTLIQLAIYGAQHGMIWVGQAESNTSPADNSGDVGAINRVGSYLGAMAQSDNVSADQSPRGGDLETAVLFGQRVAEMTLAFNYS